MTTTTDETTTRAPEGLRAVTAAGRRPGPLRPLPRVGRLRARAARLVLALLLPVVWLAAGPVAAQPVWILGHLTRDTSASWWYATVDEGIAPEVKVDRGDAWAHCPTPAYEPQTCLIVAQGPWTALTVDGVLFWERGRVYLPLVTP